ncbi:DNA primase large subunit, eukaryotic/archaeal like protein [Aduncisulcus paluster]|uniref:DNA primase large subunit, eukaryotic/archaeal like protein n=1 Tax=Aduncisulcus paluster TaxID=2918883 RepID=A0ABQ5KUL4_9EUKA|nr:DNA primase large subunit, eukaryotic/archaeal like protein [Aduncisulcus paluster]
MKFQELRNITLARLELLQQIDDVCRRQTGALQRKVLSQTLLNLSQESRFGIFIPGSRFDGLQDAISHFSLRMILCTPERRFEDSDMSEKMNIQERIRWFISVELLLFTFKLDQMKIEEIAPYAVKECSFLRRPTIDELRDETFRLHCALQFMRDSQSMSRMMLTSVVDSACMNPLECFKIARTELIASSKSKKPKIPAPSNDVFIIDDVSKAQSLLFPQKESYRTVPWQGKTIIPLKYANRFLTSKFETSIFDSIVHIQPLELCTSVDKRVWSKFGLASEVFFRKMKRRFLKSQKDSISGVTPQTLPSIARKHFPLCMRRIYDKLKTTHHLWHDERLTWVPFCRAIGLKWEDTNLIMRAEFVRSRGPEQYDKEMPYNIRHMYGLEGKRHALGPAGCRRLITTRPSAGRVNGCPFKHDSPEVMKTFLLSTLSLPESTAGEVGRFCENQNFQGACDLVFRATHPGVGGTDASMSPIDYVKEGMKHEKGLSSKKRPIME